MEDVPKNGAFSICCIALTLDFHDDTVLLPFTLCILYRVIIKINGGPVHTILKPIAYIRALKVYCYSGESNKTHVTQDTDQTYSPFKSTFRRNLEKFF